MKLVVIVGRKRSGKDTAANIISDWFDSELYQLALPIKLALAFAYSKLNLARSSGVDLTFPDFDGDGIDREQPIIISNREAYALMSESLKYLRTYYNLARRTPLIECEALGFDSVAETVTLTNTQPWSIRRMMQVLGTDIVVNHIDYDFWNRCMMTSYFNIRNKNKDVFLIKDVRQPHELSLARDLGATIIFIERDSINKNIDTHITEAGLEPEATDIIVKNDGTIEELSEKLKEVISCQMK